MTLRLVVSADPGQTGALAVLADGEFAYFADMPTKDRKAGGHEVCGKALAAAIRAIIRSNPGAHVSAVVEQVSAGGPSLQGRAQGLSSTFRFGESFGVLKGVLGAMNIPFREVHPSTWKRALGLAGLGETTEQRKELARQLAISLYPAAAPYLQRKKDNGRAESLLLARYAVLSELNALPEPKAAQVEVARVLAPPALPQVPF